MRIVSDFGDLYSRLFAGFAAEKNVIVYRCRASAKAGPPIAAKNASLSSNRYEFF